MQKKKKLFFNLYIKKRIRFDVTVTKSIINFTVVLIFFNTKQ